MADTAAAAAGAAAPASAAAAVGSSSPLRIAFCSSHTHGDPASATAHRALMRHLAAGHSVTPTTAEAAAAAESAADDESDAAAPPSSVDVLSTSDVLIAECSVASLEVGFDLARAQSQRKHILVLYRWPNASGRHISARITATQYEHQTTRTYKDETEACEIADEWIRAWQAAAARSPRAAAVIESAISPRSAVANAVAAYHASRMMEQEHASPPPVTLAAPISPPAAASSAPVANKSPPLLTKARSTLSAPTDSDSEPRSADSEPRSASSKTSRRSRPSVEAESAGLQAKLRLTAGLDSTVPAGFLIPAPIFRARSRSLGGVQSEFLSKQLRKERQAGRSRTTSLAQQSLAARAHVKASSTIPPSPAHKPVSSVFSPSMAYSNAGLPPRSSMAGSPPQSGSRDLSVGFMLPPASSDSLSSSSHGGGRTIPSGAGSLFSYDASSSLEMASLSLVPELGGRAQSAASSLRRMGSVLSQSATSSPHAVDNDFFPAELNSGLLDHGQTIGSGELLSRHAFDESFLSDQSGVFSHPEGGYGSGVGPSSGAGGPHLAELDEIDTSLLLMRTLHERALMLEQKLAAKQRADAIFAREKTVAARVAASPASASSRQIAQIAEEEPSNLTPPGIDGASTSPPSLTSTAAAAASAMAARPSPSPCPPSPTPSPTPSPASASMQRHCFNEMQLLNRNMERVVALLYKSKLSLSLRTVQLRRVMREQFLSDLNNPQRAQTADDAEIARWIASSALSTLEIEESNAQHAAVDKPQQLVEDASGDDEQSGGDESPRDADADYSDASASPVDLSVSRTPTASRSGLQRVVVSHSDPALGPSAIPFPSLSPIPSPMQPPASPLDFSLPSAPSFPPLTHSPFSGGSNSSASPPAHPPSQQSPGLGPPLQTHLPGSSNSSGSNHSIATGQTPNSAEYTRSATPIVQADELNISALIGIGFNTKRSSSGIQPIRRSSTSDPSKANMAAAAAAASASAGSASPLQLNSRRAAVAGASTFATPSPAPVPPTSIASPLRSPTYAAVAAASLHLPPSGSTSPLIAPSQATVPLTAFALVSEQLPSVTRSLSQPPSPALNTHSLQAPLTPAAARSISDNKPRNNNKTDSHALVASSGSNAGAFEKPTPTRRHSRIYFTLTPPVTEMLHKVWQWEFDIWEFVELVPDTPLSTLSCYLLERWGLFTTFNIDRATFHRFITAIEAGYLNNAYHNRIHAADVVQNMHVLLLGFMQKPMRDSVGALCTSLTPLDVLSSIIAAAIHDFRHTGTCFCEETRLLTDRGFMFGDEIKDTLAAGEPLLFACYDVASQQYVYRPCVGNKLSIDFILAPHSELVEFDSNGVSLRVTANHTMYAQWGKRDAFSYYDPCGASLRADFFLQREGGVDRPDALRFMAHAAAGVQRLLAEQKQLFALLASEFGVGPCEQCNSGQEHSNLPACPLLSFLEQYGFSLGEQPFAAWVCILLNQEQLRALVRGLWRANTNAWLEKRQCILASTVAFREELQVALLHAGYSTRVVALPDGRWSMDFADAASQDGIDSCQPSLSCSSAVRKVAYAGRVWCVTVEHSDHLIVAQRAHTDAKGVVVAQSKPLVVGQTNLFHQNTVSDLAIRYNDTSILECLEEGSFVRTADPLRPSVRVDDLTNKDVGLLLQGQSAPVPLMSVHHSVVSHSKFVISDAGGRSYAVTPNHRATLVWGRNPHFEHVEADASSSFPRWQLTLWAKTATASHAVGERVTFQLRYWPESSSQVDDEASRVELSDSLTAARAVHRGSKDSARAAIEALANEVSLWRGDVIDMEAEELWARMETEFRQPSLPHWQEDCVYAAVAIETQSQTELLAREPGVQMQRITAVTKHTRGEDAGEQALETAAKTKIAAELAARLDEWRKPHPLRAEVLEKGHLPYRFVSIEVGGNHRFQLADGTLTHNSYHIAESFELILRHKEYDIFASLTRDQRRECRETIIQMVLATDMKLHISMLTDLQATVESKKASGKWFDVSSRADRLLLLKNCLHLSDVANPTKPNASCVRWADAIVAEWFSQGDMERNLKLEISPMMDRRNANVEKSQIGFIDFFITPLYTTWAKISPLTSIPLEYLRQNRAYWQERADTNAAQQAQLATASTGGAAAAAAAAPTTPAVSSSSASAMHAASAAASSHNNSPNRKQ